MSAKTKSTQVAQAVAVATQAEAVAVAPQAAFTSLKDSAYQQAGAHQTLESVARYALEKIKDFPKEVPTEAKDMLYEGYRMKFADLQPDTVYAVINDHYVLATVEHIGMDNVEKVSIGVAYAYAYS
jgi:hypothetical protein